MTTAEAVLDEVLLRLGAADPEDVMLQPAARLESSIPLYRATCRGKWAYVDRGLAIKLRESGAGWSGALLLDPCAVA